MNLQSDIGRIIDYFKGRDEVSALYIFGSAANGKETAESDIDIAVLINDRKRGRKTYESLKKTYYSASPKFSLRPIDIVVLNTAPPFLKHRIIKTGKVLFDRNRRLRVRFTTQAIIEYLDFKPIEDFFAKAVAKRFRNTTVAKRT
ncbi:MAG: nucleotidyltransferase domain-containing protein [Nitrospirota bacterium]